jgi:hypothetical protein
LALSKSKLAIVTAIRGKLRNLLLLGKKKPRTADKIIEHTINKIDSLIVTHDLSDEEDLLQEIHDTLIHLKKNKGAFKFAKKHNLKRIIIN